MTSPGRGLTRERVLVQVKQIVLPPLAEKE